MVDSRARSGSCDSTTNNHVDPRTADVTAAPETASPSSARSERQAGTWRDEVDDAVRGVSGGLLFGIPLLFTMEVWWIGSAARPFGVAAVLVVTFVAVVVLTKAAGFRRAADVRWSDVLVDSVEAVALGLVCVSAVLLLVREITPATPLGEAVGKVVYAAAPFSLGVAVARHVLREGRDDDDDDDTGADGHAHPTFADLGATVVGALFVGFNIAPTEEVPMLTAALEPPALLAMMAASLLVSYAIVYEAGFGDQHKRRQQQGILQHPLTETAVAYLVALGTATLMLFFFGNLAGDPAPWALSQVVVLGLPAAVGGAAGRIAI